MPPPCAPLTASQASMRMATPMPPASSPRPSARPPFIRVSAAAAEAATTPAAAAPAATTTTRRHCSRRSVRAVRPGHRSNPVDWAPMVRRPYPGIGHRQTATATATVRSDPGAAAVEATRHDDHTARAAARHRRAVPLGRWRAKDLHAAQEAAVDAQSDGVRQVGRRSISRFLLGRLLREGLCQVGAERPPASRFERTLRRAARHVRGEPDRRHAENCQRETGQRRERARPADGQRRADPEDRAGDGEQHADAAIVGARERRIGHEQAFLLHRFAQPLLDDRDRRGEPAAHPRKHDGGARLQPLAKEGGQQDALVLPQPRVVEAGLQRDPNVLATAEPVGAGLECKLEEAALAEVDQGRDRILDVGNLVDQGAGQGRR